MFNHIAYKNEILSGKPHIIGTRISIEYILELFASGANKDDMIKAYPQMTAEAVEEVLKHTEKFSETAEHVLNKKCRPL